MQPELPVIRRCHDAILWFIPYLSRLPRGHRHLLGERMQQHLYELLELLIQARKSDPAAAGRGTDGRRCPRGRGARGSHSWAATSGSPCGPGGNPGVAPRRDESASLRIPCGVPVRAREGPAALLLACPDRETHPSREVPEETARPAPNADREGRSMAVVVLELDEEFQVAMARALVESPQCALVATADPDSRAGHLAAADTYEEAVEYAQGYLLRGWRVAVWEVPTRREGR